MAYFIILILTYSYHQTPYNVLTRVKGTCRVWTGDLTWKFCVALSCVQAQHFVHREASLILVNL